MKVVVTLFTLLAVSFYYNPLKVPLLWVMKGSYLVLESSTGWHACKVKKHFHFLIYAFIFTLFVQRLSNDSFKDSFFQTPPLHDANLRWLVPISRFHLKSCLWAQCCFVYSCYWGTAIVNAPKAAPSGKERICIFIQTNEKIKFSQFCTGNMLMFHVDINMKRLGIRFKNDSFQWFRVDSVLRDNNFICGALQM